MCSASLANLTSLLSTASLLSSPLLASGLLPVLLSHPASASSSVYIQDQVVTVIANLAAKLGPTARTQIIHLRALHLLVEILGSNDHHQQQQSSTKTGGGLDPAQAAATERTVSKAAIALARLCLDPVSADTVIKIGGLDRLVALAKNSNNGHGNAFSETVQLAALAAIKTITIYCSVRIDLDDADERDGDKLNKDDRVAPRERENGAPHKEGSEGLTNGGNKTSLADKPAGTKNKYQNINSADMFYTTQIPLSSLESFV